MQGLLEAIFSNFFIVIVIIAGIIGFFRDNTAKQKQQERKPNNVPRPTATPSGGGYRPREQMSPESQQKSTISTTSIEEQQKEQMEQLANRYRTETKYAMEKQSHDAIPGNTLREPKNNYFSHNQEQLKKQIGNNLGKRGLINGIIMAEVLGPPRATKPYRSVISERKK